MGMLADFLIAELRAARATRKMNQDEFGKIANYSGSHVSAVETGGRPPTEDYVAAVDEGLQTGGIYTRLLAKVTAFDDAPVWLRPWLGQSGPFIIASFDGSDDVAFMDDQLQGRVVTDPTQVARLNRIWEVVRAVALPRDLSRDLILKLVNEL